MEPMAVDFGGCISMQPSDLGRMCIPQLPFTQLGLSQCTQIDDKWLSDSVQFMSSVTYLDLSGCTRITTDGIIKLRSSLGRLRRLKLTGCFPGTSTINADRTGDTKESTSASARRLAPQDVYTGDTKESMRSVSTGDAKESMSASALRPVSQKVHTGETKEPIATNSSTVSTRSESDRKQDAATSRIREVKALGRFMVQEEDET